LKRLIGNRGFEIIYQPGDTVKLIGAVDGQRVPCTVVSELQSRMAPGTFPIRWVHGYEVELKGGQINFVPRSAIWKEADTGEIGQIYHLEEVDEWRIQPQ